MAVSLTFENLTLPVQPGEDITSTTASSHVVDCRSWHAGYRGAIELACSGTPATLAIANHTCVSFNPCAEDEDDCEGADHTCEHTGPGTHECACPVNAYGTATAIASGGTGCTGCTAFAETAVGSATNLNVSDCVCELGRYTIAATLARSITSPSDTCEAVPCPADADGPGGAGVDACQCALGFAGTLSFDVEANSWRGACATCTEGKYTDAIGSVECIGCERGRYTDRTGSTTCIGCDGGRYNGLQNSTTQSSCVECDAGLYASQPGSNVCSTCPFRHTSLVGATECAACNGTDFATAGCVATCTGNANAPDFACTMGRLLIDANSTVGYSTEACCDTFCAANNNASLDHACIAGTLRDSAERIHLVDVSTDTETCCNVTCSGNSVGPDWICPAERPAREGADTIDGYSDDMCCACLPGRSSSQAGCIDCNAGQSTSVAGSATCSPCNPGWTAPVQASLCTACPDGTMSNDSLACTQCPYPVRCQGGRCTIGSDGRGCASCDIKCTGPECESERYFQAGEKCFACPEGVETWIIALVTTICLVLLRGLWMITQVRAHVEPANDPLETREDEESTEKKKKKKGKEKEDEDDQEEFEDADGTVATMRQTSHAVSRVTDSAIFASISLPHIQFISFSLRMPFGWPDFVKEAASYVAAVFSFDFGSLTSPECIAPIEDPVELFFFKFCLTHVCFFALNLVLTLPKITGHHRALHSTNAMIAVYTQAVGSLVRKCIQTVDCTFQEDLGGVYTLNMMPEIECWHTEWSTMDYNHQLFYAMALIGCGGFAFYALFIPYHLFKRLHQANREGKLFQDEDFLESHGWLVLKYKPKRWWFEFVLLFYKVFVICVTELFEAERLAESLLLALQGATGAFLFLVVIDAPYRDSQGHSGWTKADKLQMLSLITQLANYRVATWCLHRRNANKLSDSDELLVALASLLCTVAPLVPALIGARADHKQTHAHTAGGDDSDTSDTSDQNDVETEKVQYSNPVHSTGDDDDSDEGETLAFEEPGHEHNEHENARHGRPEIEGSLGGAPTEAFGENATT